MNTLHMETDVVSALASQFKQASETMRSQTQSLNNSAQSIDWLGPSRDEFVMEVETLIYQLETQIESGMMLAQRVENEVIEWEEMALRLTGFGDGFLVWDQSKTLDPNRPVLYASLFPWIIFTPGVLHQLSPAEIMENKIEQQYGDYIRKYSQEAGV